MRIASPALLVFLSCRSAHQPATPTDRLAWNAAAVQNNAGVFWTIDTNKNGAPEPDEVVPLVFYPPMPALVKDGQFTKAFHEVQELLRHNSPTSGPDAPRQALVRHDLAQGRPTLVLSDFRQVSASEKLFVQKMMAVAHLVDGLYERQTGIDVARAHVAPDAASQSLFRRNRGLHCVGPLTEKNPLCRGSLEETKMSVGVYPQSMQTSNTFCTELEKRSDAESLLSPFSAVMTDSAGQLTPVPYSRAFASEMTKIAFALEDAAAVLADSEAALIAYLRAAAIAFRTNDWDVADEAWANMNARNSAWYIRVAPDETYWEPCSRKAGFHLTFARINSATVQWQSMLSPIQQQMEDTVAMMAGAPYRARKATFHLPDFIDIVVNAGDDRDPLGGTIGQSLPNWGPVANEGRGRTVAMANLYTDVDSRAARRAQAESVFSADALTGYVDDPTPGLFSTVLHEAAHNLGPAHEYKVDEKTDDMIFGGPIASVMEELKAQTSALYLVELLREQAVIDAAMADRVRIDALVWAAGHTAQGMYTASGERKTYSQVAAIQLGFLIDRGVLMWDATAIAANGKDRGALTIQHARLVPAINDLMKTVAGIKARGDAAAANALLERYVDGGAVPQAAIAERFLRQPKMSFVYSVLL